jgi:DNA repair protein RecO (recombination protein O)
MTQTVTPAVILRTRELRESDLIVVLLTPGRGKVDCVARGARRSRRRFPGGLPNGARGEAGIDPGRGSLSVLTSFTPTVDHSVLGRSLELFAYVAYLCELCDQLIVGSDADPATFAHLCEAIEAASLSLGLAPAQSPGPSRRGQEPTPILLRRFELALLDALGHLPALERCSVCGLPAHVTDEGVAISRERGGVLCLAHARAARRIPAAIVDLAVTLLEADPEARAAAYTQADVGTRRALRDLCREWIHPHLRSPLRSLAFFAQLGGPGKRSDPYE